MVSYYTALIALSWLALGVLCILVRENSWIPKKDKHLFYLSYGFIAFSALFEWLGVQFSGNTDIPVWLLSAVKCLDYILTPMAGGAIVAQMKLRNRWYTAMMAVLGFNAVFQIVASFNQWMIVIDDTNHYTHGPLYGFYAALYFVVIFLTAAEFLIFSLSYRKRNRASLISVFLLVIVGIVLQEAIGGDCRTAYVAMTMGVALMFIHYAEFYKMEADEQLIKQRNQLIRDELSGAFSRYAYSKDVERYNRINALSPDFTVFVFDINGLKEVNDTIGHDAGDELIIGAARCIERAVGNVSRCYRTGGDEFVVMTNTDEEQANAVFKCLEEETARWSQDHPVLNLSISSGYGREKDFPGFTVEELTKKADQAMYAAKAKYYLNLGIDRRINSTQ